MVLLRQMLPEVALERWLTMMTLENLDKLVHNTMYPGSPSLGEGKDLLLLN
jgi:hypothetical protein